MSHALAFLAGLGVALLAVLVWGRWETRRANERARRRHFHLGG